MHIALNAQLLSDIPGYRSAGVSQYCRHLIAALGQLVVDDAIDYGFSAFTHVPAFVTPGVVNHAVGWLAGSLYERPAVRIAWEQLALPGALRRVRADMVHGLVNVLPLASSIPGVVTVHDLSFLHLPDKFPLYKRLYLAALCRASVAKAAHVIAVSHRTAQDLQDDFGADPARITVVPNGVDARFTPGDPDQTARFRKDRNLPQRFLLYLGTLEPRKNLERLLSAFARWHRQAPLAGEPVKLVLAGGTGWFYEQLFDQVEHLGLHHQVQFPGYIPEAELPDWYRAATAFVYPSLFEGFGLPVLEAMACGTPVLCSAIGSLQEIVGDAALTLSPTDVDAWTAGLALITGQPRLRAELARRGQARAAQYTWRAAAEKTVSIYERVSHIRGCLE